MIEKLVVHIESTRKFIIARGVYQNKLIISDYKFILIDNDVDVDEMTMMMIITTATIIIIIIV